MFSSEGSDGAVGEVRAGGGSWLARAGRTGEGRRVSQGGPVVGIGPPPGVDRVQARGQEVVPAEEEEAVEF